MIITSRRPLAALVLSAIIAGGTFFMVDKRSDEAQRTVNDMQQRALEYQKDMTEQIAAQTRADLD
jgi:hypothetical protein